MTPSRDEKSVQAIVDVGRQISSAQDVRDAIDRIDETPFGKLGKLFDRMADDAQRAVNDHNFVIETLNAIAPAVENLACHQVQCDRDGVMIQVSRQALDETIGAIGVIVSSLAAKEPKR